jgi:hypothetical protein
MFFRRSKLARRERFRDVERPPIRRAGPLAGLTLNSARRLRADRAAVGRLAPRCPRPPSPAPIAEHACELPTAGPPSPRSGTARKLPPRAPPHRAYRVPDIFQQNDSIALLVASATASARRRVVGRCLCGSRTTFQGSSRSRPRSKPAPEHKHQDGRLTIPNSNVSATARATAKPHRTRDQRRRDCALSNAASSATPSASASVTPRRGGARAM